MILELPIQVLVLHHVRLRSPPYVVHLSLSVDVHTADQREHDRKRMLGNSTRRHATYRGDHDVAVTENPVGLARRRAARKASRHSDATRLNPVDFRTDRRNSTRSASKSEHRLGIGQHASIDSIPPILDRDEFDAGSYFLQKRHPLLASIPLLGNHDYHLLGGSPPR